MLASVSEESTEAISVSAGQGIFSVMGTFTPLVNMLYGLPGEPQVQDVSLLLEIYFSDQNDFVAHLITV